VVAVPWFPDFVNAAELAREQAGSAGHADPVGQYFAALDQGDSRTLETVWPGEVVVHDPRAGEIRGHRHLRRFVRDNQSWLAERRARIETVASTRVGRRAVVELLAHLLHDGREVAWPVAVVAESPDERSVVFRTYCSQVPVDGRRHLRPSILRTVAEWPESLDLYGKALALGDGEAVVRAFAPDGYYRESIGVHDLHRGAEELREFFGKAFQPGGGIDLQPRVVTAEGSRCAIEYDCVGWGGHELPPQAGLCVVESTLDGLLAAVRVYDDVEPTVA
jgi:ketosteroid isomerase-like protein